MSEKCLNINTGFKIPMVKSQHVISQAEWLKRDIYSLKETVENSNFNVTIIARSFTFGRISRGSLCGLGNDLS